MNGCPSPGGVSCDPKKATAVDITFRVVSGSSTWEGGLARERR